MQWFSRGDKFICEVFKIFQKGKGFSPCCKLIHCQKKLIFGNTLLYNLFKSSKICKESCISVQLLWEQNQKHFHNIVARKSYYHWKENYYNLGQFSKNYENIRKKQFQYCMLWKSKCGGKFQTANIQTIQQDVWQNFLLEVECE